MTGSKAITVFHAGERPSKGGRKKKEIKISVIGSGTLSTTIKGYNAIDPVKVDRFPPITKLSKLHDFLGLGRSIV